MLSAQITLIHAFEADLHADIGLDRIHLVQDRVLVTSTLVDFLVAPVGSALSLVGVAVMLIGVPVMLIGLAVMSIGLAVTLVGRQVPLSASIALVGGVVPLTGRLVARLAGAMSLRGDVTAQVPSQSALLHRLLTLLRLRAVDLTLCILAGEGLPQRLRAFFDDPVPLVPEVVAHTSHPAALVGNTIALSGHAVTLVRAALALLGLGSHRASLPRWGGKEVPDKS